MSEGACEQPQNPRVRVFYLSSGPIGGPILDALRADARVDLVGVGSQPDRPVGRRQHLTPTAFAQYALARGCEVERVASVNTPEFLEHLRALAVEVVLVVSFGQLLKKAILELPSRGCLNVHASLLPRYRGACPISSAILNGDAVTGVSFMRMDAGLDTGPVYASWELPILPEENAGDLEMRLGGLAASHVVDVVWGVAREGMAALAQPPATSRNVHKISKNDGIVDWHASAVRIANMVRAYQPWPRAFTYIPVHGKLRRLQITAATACPAVPDTTPGQILPDQRDGLRVATGDGVLLLRQVIPEGGKGMDAVSFLRGNPVMPGCILE
jgi:methionyl-tRNA formyltransferase